MPTEQGYESGDRGDEQHGIPPCRVGQSATESSQIEGLGSVPGVESVGGHPGEQKAGGNGSHQERGTGTSEIRPIPESDERGAVGRQNGCGERVGEREHGGGDAVRDPAPATASFERNDEEKGGDDDPEKTQCIRPRLARSLDHASVGGQGDPGDEALEAAEHDRAENHQKPCRDSDGDRRRCPEGDLVGPNRRREFQQQEMSGLARVVVHDRRGQRAERPLCLRSRRGLARRERAVSECHCPETQ